MKYTVRLTQIAYEFSYLTVEAASPEEAQQLALKTSDDAFWQVSHVSHTEAHDAQIDDQQ